MQRKERNERLPWRIDPGENKIERCAPGSIEQELDMCESGSLRGDEITFHPETRGKTTESETDENEPQGVDDLMNKCGFQIDMSEEGREGDEMSGDEHSAGLQGGEAEIEGQGHILTGLPGDWTQHEGTHQTEEIENIGDFGVRAPKQRKLKKRAAS